MCIRDSFRNLKYKDKDAIDLWSNFEPSVLSIGASLDASGARGEYIRKGTIWSETVKNRERMKREIPRVDFNISCTVSMFNILNVVDFYEEMVSTKMIGVQDFAVNILLGKHIHRCTVLPERYRLQAQKDIERLLEKIKDDDPLGRVTNTFKSLHQFLDDDMSHLMLQSMKEAKEMDRFRSETLFDAIPELGEIEELVYLYENAESLQEDPRSSQVDNFAQGEGTVE